ncbi:MAG: ATP-binding protein [Thermodesulfobacteriota bacterium]|nr:ATP-binding protein [Thermodesulfobacteriota bacterium]
MSPDGYRKNVTTDASQNSPDNAHSSLFEAEIHFKIKVLRALMVAGIPFALYYGFLAFKLNYQANACLNLFIVALLVTGLVLTFKVRSPDRQARYIIIISHIYFACLAVLHINLIVLQSAVYYFWFILTPMIICIVLGYRRGGLVAIVYGVVVVACLLLITPPPFYRIAGDDLRFQTTICIIMAAVISLIYEYMRSRTHKLLIEKQRALIRSEHSLEHMNQRLEQAVRDRTIALEETNKILLKEISIREQSERALQESEEKYRDLVQYAPAGIYEFDMQTLQFLSVNDVMCEYTGYTEKEFLAMDPLDLITEENQNAFTDLVADVYENKPRELSTEYKIKGKNQRAFWVVANARFFYEEGKPVRAMAVVHDLTEIRRGEEERRKLEAQLQNVKRLESLEILAGGVAHDLNNILSGIVSYPDLLLLDLDKDSPFYSPLVKIKQSGEKAAEIVQDLLTLARIEVASKKAVSLNRVVEEYLASPECAKLAAASPEVTMQTRLENDLINVFGSDIHLFKIVMNLVTNAVDASPSGGDVIISTRSGYLDQPFQGFETIAEGEYTVLTVEDNGIGMSETDLEHIFEPFYTKKRMGRSGTGLGMSVVWGTVKSHDGFVDIRTEEGAGTTVSLYFPAFRQAESVQESACIEDYLGNGESVLVIDDVPEQRGLACRMLQRLGYQAEGAESGETALAMIRERSYDLLVLDMIMEPGWNGLETYRAILEIAPNQRAVIASGFSETTTVKKTQALGAGLYIKKPYSLEKIGLAVRSELDRC